MKRLTTNEFLNAMDGKNVALVLDTSMRTSNSSHLADTVARWKASASTMGNLDQCNETPLNYQHASKAANGILKHGNAYRYIFDADCYQGENGLLFAVKINTYYDGGIATHVANIQIFEVKSND